MNADAFSIQTYERSLCMKFVKVLWLFAMPTPCSIFLAENLQ